jgi:hypothetical protein
MKQQFEYMLLSRLQSDCHAWLSGGGSLWGIDPKTHADKMVELYNQLKIKPKWLTYKELKNLYYSLTKTELKQ